MGLDRFRYGACGVGCTALVLLLVPSVGTAFQGSEGGGVLNTGTAFFWIAIILLAAKMSNLVTRFGQPPVLGEFLVGVVLGNLTLVGCHFFEPIRQDLITPCTPVPAPRQQCVRLHGVQQTRLRFPVSTQELSESVRILKEHNLL